MAFNKVSLIIINATNVNDSLVYKYKTVLIAKFTYIKY